MLYATPHPSSSLGLFAWMCDSLRRAVAPHTRLDTARGRLMHFLWAYFARASIRLDKLFTKWRSGKLRPARPRKPGKPRAANPRAIRVPRGNLWLLRRLQPAPIGGDQFRALFADAEFLAFLRDCPAARRILRPFCASIGYTPPDFIQTPPRPRQPRPKKPRPEPPKRGKYPRFNPRTYSPGRIPDPVKKPA